MDAQNPLRALWIKAGFRTAKDFAGAAGLQDYEVSRIVSPTSPRRPTWAQLRKMAPLLQVSATELAATLLPPGDPEAEHLVDVLHERDELLRQLGEVRLKLTEVDGELRARVSEVQDLTKRLGTMSYELESQGDALRAVQGERLRQEHELRAERQARAELDAKLARLEGELATARSAADAVREQAGKELVALREQLAALRTSSSDELAKERTRAVEKAILGGTLGAIAGAVITAAASRGGDDEDVLD